MSNTQKSILGGVTILGLTGIICKVIGVIFRIPLAWLIGEEGVATYQLVFPTYNLLLTISSAGIPVAISRMVSHCLAQDDPRNSKRVFKTALYLLLTLGLITTIIMIACSPNLSKLVGDPQTQLGFITIAPSLLIVCVMSAFRGFMQGQQNMTPTAISQLIEQVGKVAIALPLAYAGFKIDIAHAAAGALLGTSISEGLALTYMVVLYFKRRASFAGRLQDPMHDPIATSVLSKRLMVNAIPITLGACIVPLASFVDSAMLVNRMVGIGIDPLRARLLYGCFSGFVITLINVPTALAAAVSMSLVPAISGALAKKDYDTIARQSQLGLRFAFLMGLPCSAGMSILAEPILKMIYGNTISPENLGATASLLAVSSLTIVLFMVVQATSGILQGLRKQRIPMYTLLAGVICKITLNYILVGIPSINIHGAPIASLVCYTVSMVPNLYYVFKYARTRFDWMGCLIRPGGATLIMSALVLGLKAVLPSGRLITVVLIVAGIAAYCVFCVVFKAVTSNDLSFLKRRKVKK